MSRHRALAIAAVIAVVLVVASGGFVFARMRQSQTPPAATTTPTATMPATAMLQHTWKLETFTYQGQPQTLVPGVSITLTFSTREQQAGGFSGCNDYGGTYTISQGHLKFGDLVQTLIACAQNSVMEQESHYMTALRRVTTYRLDQSGLTLRDDTGQYVLRYVQTTTTP